MVELETVNDPTVPAQSFQLMLPTASCIATFWPASQQCVALPHELQKPIPSKIGAIYVGFSLLLVMINAAHWHQGKRKTPTNIGHRLPWILDSCSELWKHLGRWTLNTDKRPLQDETVDLYMQLLEIATFPQEEPQGFCSFSQKRTQGLLSALSGLLDMSSLSEGNQIRLASMLVRLQRALNDLPKPAIDITQRHNDPTLVVTEELGAAIAQVCRNAEKFSGLQRDLQVRKG